MNYQEILSEIRVQVERGEGLSPMDEEWLLDALDRCEDDVRQFAGQEE